MSRLVDFLLSRIKNPPTWTELANKASELGDTLPIRGFVRGPDKLVHGIIGDWTECDVQWATFVKGAYYAKTIHGWHVAKGEAVFLTCMQCINELSRAL